MKTINNYKIYDFESGKVYCEVAKSYEKETNQSGLVCKSEVRKSCTEIQKLEHLSAHFTVFVHRDENRFRLIRCFRAAYCKRFCLLFVCFQTCFSWLTLRYAEGEAVARRMNYEAFETVTRSIVAAKNSN